jgi:hypothetical protein
MTFPTTLSSYTGNETLNDAQHAQNHNALEAKLGIDSSAVVTSIDYLLKSTSSSDPGHKHTLANGATDVTATYTQLNYLASATGTTGTASTNLVFSTSPTLTSPTFTTPTLGAATATSINKVTITAPTTSATLTLVTGSSLITSGAYAITLTSTNTTNVTLPTTGTLATLAGTETFTNKRITKRIETTASSATPTPASDDVDMYTVTALAEAATFGAPTGTPTNGQGLIIRIKDNGTARALSFNAIYRFSSDLSAPTTTIISKTIYLGFIYNTADTKWDCVAYLNNF